METMFPQGLILDAGARAVSGEGETEEAAAIGLLYPA